MPDPLVSVLIPSYKPRHFELALTSALAQAYPNLEIIVSDDCPTDDIERICANYPRVQYSRNPDRGPNTNLRRLTRLASGEYLKYLMDDDILHPLCVRRMADALNQEPSVKLAFSARDRIDADSRILNQNRSIKSEGQVSRLAGHLLRRRCILNVTNPIGEFTTVMFRRADVIGADGEQIYTRYHGSPITGLTDIATFLQLLETGDAVHFEDALSLFRIHPAANTQNVASPGVYAGLAEWALFARQAATDPRFGLEDRLAALTNARARLSGWAVRFPGLGAEVAALGELAAELAPEGASR